MKLLRLALLAVVITPAQADVVRFEQLSADRPAFQGRAFGDHGTVEKITARATVAIDPSDPRNAIIADLAAAPRNAQGRVEATADVVILKPARPNGVMLLDIPNRGRKLLGALIEESAVDASSRLEQASDAGRGFLLSQGYTVVWVGWQADLPAGGGMRVDVPAVQSVTGLSREEWSFDHTRNPIEVQLTYPAADPDPVKARLTVRARAGDQRSTPADLSFRFLDPQRIEITRPAQGFDASALYELTYVARDPKVAGLGLAAIRDVASFLRYDVSSANPLVVDGRPGVDRAIGFGISQSGQVLRDFLHFGFNEDEAGRIVFDGMMPHIAGSRRSFTNARFAQPSRNPAPHTDRYYPADQFPFAYGVTTDTLTGRKDGLLLRCRLSNTCPRIMHIDTEYELWGSRGSLVVTDTRGYHLQQPPEVRLYMITGAPHFAQPNAVTRVNPSCELPMSPIHAGAPVRALLIALNSWIVQSVAPPETRYPQRADGTLATAENLYGAIPALPYRAQYNPAQWVEQADPIPVVRGEYPVLLPKPDLDGNTIAGIRLPMIEAARATYTAWNPMKGSAAATLCNQQGGVLPLANTREERLSRGDPRLSLEERYSTPDAYVKAVEAAAQRLVAERVLLAADAAEMIEAAKAGRLAR